MFYKNDGMFFKLIFNLSTFCRSHLLYYLIFNQTQYVEFENVQFWDVAPTIVYLKDTNLLEARVVVVADAIVVVVLMSGNL